MNLNLSNFNQALLLQVLEYHPEPWDQWVTVGSLEVGRNRHAVLSIGVEHLPCLSGKDGDLSKLAILSVLLRVSLTFNRYKY